MNNHVFHLDVIQSIKNNDDGETFKGSVEYTDSSEGCQVKIKFEAKFSKEAMLGNDTDNKLHNKICKKLRQEDLQNGGTYNIEIAT